jgi:hypothetical protein
MNAPLSRLSREGSTVESLSIVVQERHLHVPEIVLNNCGVSTFQLQQRLHVKSH